MYCIMQFLKYIIPKPLKYSPMSLKSMRFQKCYNFHCSKCTKSILFQKEDASSSRRKCSQLLRMPNCCQKFLRGTLGKKNIPNELFYYNNLSKWVTVMLVTSLCWWLIWDVGGRIIMLATFFVMLMIFWMYQIGH